MTVPKTEEYVFEQGECFKVEFYFNEAGKMSAREYLEKASLRVKVRLAALVKYIAENGRLFDKTKFRQVHAGEGIFEFKPADHRFFSFFYKDGRLIITNAYIKKSQKVSRKDLERAIIIKKDYIRRVKGGVYYGKS